MSPSGATLANTLWLAGSVAPALRYHRALADPQGAQERWLLGHQPRHASSTFGRSHGFDGMGGVADFTRLVPLADYDAIADQVARVRAGEPDVLAHGRITHLVPTSGSTGARKLIPFGASLQEGFSAALGPWMTDLARQRPGWVGGPAYWSVSPLTEQEDGDGGVIPVGFADDADYVGGPTAWLVRRALAVPSGIRHVRDVATFRRLTLLALLRRRDLRLISVWHPSFLDLLVGTAGEAWEDLLEAVAAGRSPWDASVPDECRQAWQAAPDAGRAAELRRTGPIDWPGWWPRLAVVSCWGDQAASGGFQALRSRLPGVLVQAKGLLATEAVVTVPIGAQHPLAVTSHFFEFIDDAGNVLLAHQLRRGIAYEVVVTNGGGLWRYRLRDMVECTGHLRATPCLRFLGRAGRVSDLRGEKLSETFVAEILRGIWRDEAQPAVAMLRASDGPGVAWYELLLSADAMPESPASLESRLDEALAANPHYALARRLGQLAPVRLRAVDAHAVEAMLSARGGRLGDAKPAVLAVATVDRQ